MTVASRLKTQHTLAIDANDDTQATASLDLELAREVFVAVEAASGAHTNHVLKIQMSADNVNWHTHGSATVTGVGFMTGTVGSRWMRVKVTTEEAGASTVNVRVNARA